MIFLLGLLIAAALFFFDAAGSPIFSNPHSAVVVIGGTIIVTFLVTPLRSLKSLAALVREVIREPAPYRGDELKVLLKNAQAPIRDPFGLINQARNLWALGVSAEEFENTLRDQAETLIHRNQAAIATLRSLGKYPPALGMIGTVMGMIRLFEGLGSNVQQSAVGRQLAFAMTATLYGLLVSNLIIVPLADRLDSNEECKRADLEILIKTLVAIGSNRPRSVSEKVLHVA
jgi:chemotaxis protein MotA